MKQCFACLWVAVRIYFLTVFMLSNALALISFSEGREWKMIMISAVFSFMAFSIAFIPLVPVLFAFFYCGRKLHWRSDAFFFYCTIAGLSLTVGVFLFFSNSGYILFEGRDGALPVALFASGLAVFLQRGAIRRLASYPELIENFPIDDNPLNSTN
jgi:hypothetical protein